MSKVREVFDRAINAMVDSTKLAQEVAELRKVVADIKYDLEYVRNRNKELDEMLHTTREQRDTAQRELNETRDQLARAQVDFANSQQEIEHKAREINDLREALERAKSERDAYGLEAMQAKEDLAKANDKLESIAKLFLQQPANVPQASPTPEPPTPTQAEPKRVYEDQPGFSWDKPTTWDPDRRLSFNHV